MERMMTGKNHQRWRLTSRLRNYCWRALLVAMLAVLCGDCAAAQAAGPTEYQVKAAFLFNFAKFVDWPPNTFASPQSPFLICILGNDPFGQAIDQTLRGQSIGGRQVAVQRVRNASELRRCQMAFIGSTEHGHLDSILQAVQGANVLLVGESPGFAAAGGAIQFEMKDDRVRFSINPDAAARAGLRVSSKLLALATIVHDPAGKRKG